MRHMYENVSDLLCSHLCRPNLHMAVLNLRSQVLRQARGKSVPDSRRSRLEAPGAAAAAVAEEGMVCEVADDMCASGGAVATGVNGGLEGSSACCCGTGTAAGGAGGGRGGCECGCGCVSVGATRGAVAPPETAATAFAAASAHFRL